MKKPKQTYYQVWVALPMVSAPIAVFASLTYAQDYLKWKIDTNMHNDAKYHIVEVKRRKGI